MSHKESKRNYSNQRMAHENGSDYYYVNDETNNVDSLTLATIMFSLCFIGVFGNIVSMVIFSRRSMRSSINVLLWGLSLIDLFVLVFAVPVFGLPTFTEAVPNKILEATYPYIVLVLYPMSMVCQTSSVWTFVLINIERYLAICHPFCVRKFFTTQRTRIFLATIVALAFFYNFIRFWEFEPDSKYGVTQLLRYNRSYYHIYYTSLYLITHFAGPFLTMLILNIFMFRGIKNARKMREILTKRVLMQERTTHMIVLVTVMFGLCNTLPFVLNIWEACEPDLFWERIYKPALLTTDVSNCLVILNSSTTFLIYLMYCKKYRKLFLRMFRLITVENGDLVTDNVISEFASRNLSRMRSCASEYTPSQPESGLEQKTALVLSRSVDNQIYCHYFKLNNVNNNNVDL